MGKHLFMVRIILHTRALRLGGVGRYGAEEQKKPGKAQQQMLDWVNDELEADSSAAEFEVINHLTIIDSDGGL
ncbi:hypothetical protein BDV30DRAFT_213727, partial [Aspergillus minisclerotigenes]